MHMPSRTLVAAAVAALLVAVGFVARSGPAGRPGCAAAWAADPPGGRRLLAALATPTDDVLELWERQYPVTMFERAGGVPDSGPDGEGVPSSVLFVLRRNADGSKRWLVGAAYLRDWIAARSASKTDGPKCCAALAVDPRGDSLSLVVARNSVGVLELEHLALTMEAKGDALGAGDPFATEDPAGPWPIAPVLYGTRAAEGRRIRLPSDAERAVAATLVSDETGLLFYARPKTPAKSPLYFRRKAGSEAWELIRIDG